MNEKSVPEKKVEVKKFTIMEISAGIRKLKRRIDEVKKLLSTGVRFNNARVNTAETNIRETIRYVFGQYSPEFYDYQHYSIWEGGYYLTDNDHARQVKFEAGIPQAIIMLEGLIDRLNEKLEDIAPTVYENQTDEYSHSKAILTKSKVFIVHGHDEEAKQTVARFIEKLKLESVILNERPSEGRTIIEKFEKHSDVDYAIVLLTPDDMGYPKDKPDKVNTRARQNVILELGYFVGRLTRAKVCALYKGSIEMPSDFHGVIYIQMDEAGGWKLKLASEIKQSGLDIDLNFAV